MLVGPKKSCKGGPANTGGQSPSFGGANESEHQLLLCGLLHSRVRVCRAQSSTKMHGGSERCSQIGRNEIVGWLCAQTIHTYASRPEDKAFQKLIVSASII